ncbi:MAG: hypothetical protein GWP91_06510 [Rhodobacterales bacterium]|nr:hypothetical protein [Rhodobacterales bacterium]
MNIQHTIETEPYISKDGRCRTTAEQRLDGSTLRAEITQWENDNGPYESASLDAPHVHCSSYAHKNGIAHNHSISLHQVNEVKVTDDRITVQLRDGSTVYISLFHAAE